MAQYSPYSQIYANQFGIPVDVLDSAIYVQGTTEPIEAQRIARQLSENYASTKDWGAAVDQFALKEFGDNAEEYGGHIRETAGIGPKPADKAPGAAEEKPWYSQAGDWLGEKAGGAKDAVMGAAGEGLTKFAGGAFLAVAGVALIILAVMMHKPIRDAAITAATRGVVK